MLQMTRRIWLSVFMSLLLTPVVSGDVVTDGSLGVATSLAGPNFAVGPDLGQQRGANLFHSFSQLNVANGESVTFSGPAPIANIIVRVTGGTLTTIDGLFRSDVAGANVFILNPAGHTVGPNSAADVGNSLHLSSADYLTMGDLTQFLSVPLQGEVLSSAAPTIFGFLATPIGPLQIQGANWSLGSGATLSLVGGETTVAAATITIDSGEILVTSLASAGEVTVATGEPGGPVSPGIVGISASTLTASTVDLEGRVAPGGSPGTFAIGGDLDLDSDTALVVEIEGLTPGTQYDQILVDQGSPNLTGSSLEVNLPGPAPSVGNVFTIISVGGSGASVTGTFSGLPEGGSVDVGPIQMTISYVGGDGNDVALSVVAVPVELMSFSVD